MLAPESEPFTPETKAKLKTHSVVYKNLVVSAEGGLNHLTQYYLDANKAADVLSNFFLDIFGGIGVNDLTNARYKTVSKADEKDKEKKELRPDQPATFPDAVLLFFHWFTLEDREAPTSLQSFDVMPRFLSYLKAEHVSLDPKWREAIEATVYSSDEHSLPLRSKKNWVDRRASHLLLRDKIGFSAETIAWIFQDPNFVLQEKEVDSHAYTREFLSINLVKGEKSDFAGVSEKSGELILLMQRSKETTAEGLRLECCRHLGVSATPSAGEVSAMLGKRGRPPGFANFLAGNKLDDKKPYAPQIIELIQKINDKTSWRLSRPDDPEAWEKAKNYLVTAINLPFEFKFYNEFCGMGMARIRSHRKNSLNMLIKRYMLDRARPNIHPELAKLIDDWCKEHQQEHLWSGDIDGFFQMRQMFTGNYTDTINLVEKRSRNRRINFAFLKLISKFLDLVRIEKPLDVIERYQEATKCDSDFRRWRTPSLANFTDAPNHPQWGESRPTAAYLSSTDKQVGDKTITIHTYHLEILSLEGIQKVTVETVNKRAKSDLMVLPEFLTDKKNIVKPMVDDTRTTGRRTKLIAADKNAMWATMDELERERELATLIPCLEDKKKTEVRKATIALNSGVKLYRHESGKLYLYLTFNLPSKPTLPLTELAKLKPFWRFMAFDPGVRKNITYAIGEVVRVPESETKPCLKDGLVLLPMVPGLAIRVIETGALREKDFRRDSGHAVCRLESDACAYIPPEAKDLWEELRKDDLVTKDPPEKITAFLQEAIYALFRYARREEKPSDRYLKLLTDLTRYQGRNSGHLSYRRIKNLMSLKSLYQLHLKKNPQPWMATSLQYAFDKIRNMRMERIRRVANLVCQKALEHRVRAVFPEKTNLDIHVTAPKWMMRNVDIWTPRKVLDQCEAQLNPLGIFVRRVISDYSSHTDFADDTMKPRYDDLTAEMIRREIDFFANVRNVMGETAKVYRAEIEYWLQSRGLSWDSELVLEAERFPRKGGDYFKNSLLGWMNADIQAAVYLLKRGVRSIVGIKEPTQKKPRMVRNKK